VSLSSHTDLDSTVKPETRVCASEREKERDGKAIVSPDRSLLLFLHFLLMSNIYSFPLGFRNKNRFISRTAGGLRSSAAIQPE